ncbi:MAG TPA: hypothetical protein VHS31_03215 [Tepidisphaeraceae bacterium]|nr:hypothetical protein [Tepidisphaeraceae bacterium]
MANSPYTLATPDKTVAPASTTILPATSAPHYSRASKESGQARTNPYL